MKARTVLYWRPKGVDAMPRLVVAEDYFRHPRRGLMFIVSLVFDGGKMQVVPEDELMVMRVPRGAPEVQFMTADEAALFRVGR